MPRNALIQFRHGTAAEWAAAAPVILAEGEPGHIDDTGVTKVGDGVTAFADLPSVASFTGHDAIYFRAKVLGGGTATLNTNNTAINFGSYWLFDDTVEEFVNFEWYPPIEWEAYVGRIGFVAVADGGNDVMWRWDVNELAIGGNPGTAKVAGSDVILPGPTGLGAGWTYGDVKGTAANPIEIDPVAEPVQMVTIRRRAGDLQDDMVGDAGLAIVTVTRIA